jgi:hypothetical protein
VKFDNMSGVFPFSVTIVWSADPPQPGMVAIDVAATATARSRRHELTNFFSDGIGWVVMATPKDR